MFKGRVLFVDDLRDVRITWSGLLSDEGYLVRSASSRAEALKLLDAERFHVAILDVRLDESDEGNQDGLTLMREIKEKHPTVAVIVLTAYANVKMVQEALQPDRTGSALAFGFLEKTAVDHVLEYVRRAFERAVRVDAELQIQDPAQFLSQLSETLRFSGDPRPSKQQLAEEAEELLRKLFFGRTRIELQPIRSGYSGVAICKLTPWHQELGRGETLIVKFGEVAAIEQEIEKYETLVHGMIGGHRIPNMLRRARTWSLAGVVYTFAGLDSPRDFGTFYALSDIPQIRFTLTNLFLETCFPSRFDSGVIHRNLDLGPEYAQLLHLHPAKLRTCLDRTMGGRHPFCKDGDGRRIWMGDEIPLPNPVAFALSSDLRADTYICIIHGDLQGYNVLVDRHNEAWLIDFANTRYGPLLQDYACFETFLRLSLVECANWRLLYAWDRALFDSADLCTSTLPQDLADIPEINKAHHAILTVRQLALQRGRGDAERSYLAGLMFTALKVMTIMDLPRARRDHALISAALIAERLQRDT